MRLALVGGEECDEVVDDDDDDDDDDDLDGVVLVSPS
jgi:hypothetical protein